MDEAIWDLPSPVSPMRTRLKAFSIQGELTKVRTSSLLILGLKCQSNWSRVLTCFIPDMLRSLLILCCLLYWTSILRKSNIVSRFSEAISSVGVLQPNSLSRDSRLSIVLLQSSRLISDIQKLPFLRLDRLGFGKLHMQIRQKRPEPGGPLVETLRSHTDEHPPAVAFENPEYLISGLLGVLSACLILDQKVRHHRMQIFDHLVDALDLRFYGELAVTSVKGVDDLTASVK